MEARGGERIGGGVWLVLENIGEGGGDYCFSILSSFFPLCFAFDVGNSCNVETRVRSIGIFSMGMIYQFGKA